MIIKMFLVFLSTFLADMLWTYYITAVARNKEIAASVLNGGIVLLGAILTFGYMESRLYIIPAVVGAILGTFIAMKTKKKDINIQ